MPALSDLFGNLHVDILPPSPRERLKYFRKSPELRRNTFKKNKWPSTVVTVEDLVDDGFFYVGDGKDDRVQCSFCGGILTGFQEGDDVHKEHYKHFPDCERFLLRDNCYDSLFTSTDCNDADDLEVDGEITDITAVDGHVDTPLFQPRHKYYSTYEDRLKTFQSWPKGKLPSPENIARAGMFFTGTDDCCECFYCGGQLDQWEEEDKPQEEHDSNFSSICRIAKNK